MVAISDAEMLLAGHLRELHEANTARQPSPSNGPQPDIRPCHHNEQQAILDALQDPKDMHSPLGPIGGF